MMSDADTMDAGCGPATLQATRIDRSPQDER